MLSLNPLFQHPTSVYIQLFILFLLNSFLHMRTMPTKEFVKIILLLVCFTIGHWFVGLKSRDFFFLYLICTPWTCHQTAYLAPPLDEDVGGGNHTCQLSTTNPSHDPPSFRCRRHGPQSAFAPGLPSPLRAGAGANTVATTEPEDTSPSQGCNRRHG